MPTQDANPNAHHIEYNCIQYAAGGQYKFWAWYFHTEVALSLRLLQKTRLCWQTVSSI